ncbi:small GTPase superfamily, partial [Cercophora newfieldiana]
FKVLRHLGYQQCDAVVLVYDITDRASFSAVERLHAEIRPKEDVPPGSPIRRSIMLVGNKADLASDRKVTAEEGGALSRELGCQFLEASAKSGVNVEKAFYDLVRTLRAQ